MLDIILIVAVYCSIITLISHLVPKYVQLDVCKYNQNYINVFVNINSQLGVKANQTLEVYFDK